ncbi:MAG: DPP IV N-terminal domain-containing protein [Anaerolineae bacterium]|nr:DPP IV N-terminal domain-containing protein [Anaerolineae bacterium]
MNKHIDRTKTSNDGKVRQFSPKQVGFVVILLVLGIGAAFFVYQDRLARQYIPFGRLVALDMNQRALTLIEPNAQSALLPDFSNPYRDLMWSPVGAQIALASTHEGNFELYLLNADDNAITRLTTDPAIDRYPTWSPDATEIIFSSTRGGIESLYRMDADGQNVRLWLENATQPHWSGDQVAFVRGSNIYSARSDGSEIRQLATNGSQPRWSNDGRFLAFIREGETQLLTLENGNVINESGLGLKPIVYALAWLPDNETLLVNTGNPAHPLTSALYQYNVITADYAARYLLLPGISIFSPSVSPNGDQIAYLNFGRVTVSNMQPIPESIVSIDETGFDIVLSPDQTQMVFTRNTDWPSQQIWIANADGSAERAITDAEISASEPVWSPDGTQILYTSSTDPADNTAITQLCLIDLTTAALTPTCLTDDHQDRMGAWSSDDQRIAFIRGRDSESELFILDRADGTITQLTDNDVAESDPAWSPDGRSLAFVRADNNLRVINADGTNERDLYQDGAFIVDPVWSADASQIAIANADSQAIWGAADWYITIVPLATPDEPYTIVAKSYARQLRFNAEGDSLYFSEQNVLMQVSNHPTLASDVTLQSYRFDSPSLSDNGEWFTVLYGMSDDISFVEAPSQLLRLHLPSGAITPIQFPVNPSFAALSPNGATLLVIGYTEDNADGYLYTFADATLQPLTNDALIEYEAAWSPDGREIVLSVEGDLVVINVDGTERRVLIEENGINRNPVWSPDGDTIAFVRDGTAVYLVQADGTNEREFSTGVDSSMNIVYAVEWSPDGRSLVISTAPFWGYGMALYTLSAPEDVPRTLCPSCTVGTWSR